MLALLWFTESLVKEFLVTVCVFSVRKVFSNMMVPFSKNIFLGFNSIKINYHYFLTSCWAPCFKYKLHIRL